MLGFAVYNGQRFLDEKTKVYEVYDKQSFSTEMDKANWIIRQVLVRLIIGLPIIAPLIWLAIFSSARRHEATKLALEFAYRENLLNIYSVSMKEKKYQKLSKELMENTIESISKNPSDILSGDVSGETPLGNMRKTLEEKQSRK